MAEVSTLDGIKVIPKDLEIKSQPDTDKNFTRVTITNLKIDKTYAMQFQYVFKDNVLSEWSPSFIINTSTEAVPGAPSATVPTTSTTHIPVTLSVFPTNVKRVDIYVIGGTYGTGKVVDYFLAAGTKSISVPGGTYQVSLIPVTSTGISGVPSSTFTITVSDAAGETVQAPTNPNGFSINRVLSGIEVVWAGTYANGTFTGFEAIKIYVGTSATATPGTYQLAGVLTGNNVRNSIVIPVDGTYVRYDQPVYIHAAALNRNGTEGTLQQNVASNLLGARSAIASDLADQIITNAKLVDDAVTAAKIAINSITNTKIADDAISTPKLQTNAITADKIVASAVTTDKIATNAITATKILAGTIDVTKLSAGTISVNNLEAGTLGVTSFIRAGSTTGGARIEMSTANITNGPSAGFYIYNSQGNPVLSAPLSGGLTINGSGTFTGDLSTSSGLFSVSNGILTALSGSIGGWSINSTVLRSSASASTVPRVELNPLTPGINVVSASGTISLNTTSGLSHSSGSFTLSPAGNLSLAGSITSTATISGGTLNGATINLNGSQTGSGSGGSYTETSDTSQKLNLTTANYSVIPASDSWQEEVSTVVYDPVNDEFTTSISYTTVTKKTVKLTDSTYKGGVPSSGYHYGELWTEGGTNWGSAVLYANGGGEYWGIEVRKSTTDSGFYLNGWGSNWTDSHISSTGKDQPAYLQADSAGKVTRGRALFTGGRTLTSLNSGTNPVGQNGDLYFSTA